MKTRNSLEAYEIMLKSRRLDEFLEGLDQEGIRVPHLHTAIGQEALSVGGAIDLREEDYLIYTHRGYGALLAKGIQLKDLMLDFFCKAGGTNDGFGSVMHVCDQSKGIIGREGVFGTKFTIAAGLALSIRNRKKDDVVMCYFGEAAGARGPFLEAMNMCVLWSLPVIFLGENNGFSVSSRTKDIYSMGNMTDMWRGFNIPVVQFDGNDLEGVRRVVNEAIERARLRKGPSMLEGFTYRIGPHIPGEDHLAYRNVEEIEKWRKKDPLGRTREKLIHEGMLTGKDERSLEERIHGEIEKAYEEARSAPSPAKENLYKMVYME